MILEDVRQLREQIRVPSHVVGLPIDGGMKSRNVLNGEMDGILLFVVPDAGFDIDALSWLAHLRHCCLPCQIGEANSLD